MTWWYRNLVWPALAIGDAEDAHHLALRAMETAQGNPLGLEALGWMHGPLPASGRVRAFGLDFPSPLGLAAGFDKNGAAVDALDALGFGFVEVGTVTPVGQPGNPRPRMTRVPSAHALINRLGFPNAGAVALAAALRRRRSRGILGVNIGKGKDTPLEQAPDDYAACLRTLYPLGDYFVVNVSSPNTVGLRQLQAREHLDELARRLTALNSELAVQNRIARRPLLLKIAPDLTWGELDDVLTIVQDRGLDGIVATNPTLRREGIPPAFADIPGGLSGPPLRQRATEVIAYIAQHTGGRLPVIGVGGISTAEDMWEKLAAGAVLVQAYTGFVYHGPTFAADLARDLDRALRLRQMTSVADLRR
ncbi:MAG: quinone-dependent dihydroorotate dehydrogenase [Chloroflexi bacterium]|nr:quinone-dependent dihydroorotate dehydrogenase [Chloroflexota bacterium]